jgi:hypothetical protein
MHLPTINHIDLSSIVNFPLSSLTPSVNLHRLDMFWLKCFDGPEVDGSSDIVVQSEMMPKIREFHTSHSTLLTTKLIHAKLQDGRPAFNFIDLRRLSIDFIQPEDERIIRYLLQNAKLLDTLHFSVVSKSLRRMFGNPAFAFKFVTRQRCLSIATGHQKCHPLYISTVNITYTMRRSDAVGKAPVALLPIHKSKILVIVVGESLQNLVDKKRVKSMNIEKLGRAGFNGFFISVDTASKDCHLDSGVGSSQLNCQWCCATTIL